MLTIEELDARRTVIEDSPDLRALAERLTAQSITVRRRAPTLPAGKGMLSADGGSCPDHRRALKLVRLIYKSEYRGGADRAILQVIIT